MTAFTSALTRLSQRLEALTMRERVLVLVGLPVALVVLAEMLVFDKARKTTEEAAKIVASQRTELETLSALLAQTPSAAGLPAADQLERQREEAQGQIAAARTLLDSVRETVDWGTVVRGAVNGSPGLVLTSLRALPPELVFSSAKAAAATPNATAAGRPAAAAPGAAASAPAALPAAWANLAVYRHRAELTVRGDFSALQGYLAALQRVPGGLHWEKLSLNAAQYPQAQMQLILYTLSDRAQTPFN